MRTLIDKYVNPFKDFGFKKLFGEEIKKDLLIDFLNEILKNEEGLITDLTYLPPERLGRSKDERKAIFDLYCLNDRGERFIVELQKTKQKFFKDRTLYYATFPIQEQALRNEWDFELKSVYTIAILDFIFDEDKNDVDKYRYDVKLSDIQSQKIFYNKLTFIYFEMPKFTKKIEDLQNKYEKWLYLFKNISLMESIPDSFQENIFQKLFRTAELAKFSEFEYYEYESSLKVYRDLNNSFNTAYDDGLTKGIAKGLAEGHEKGLAEGREKGLAEGIEKGRLQSVLNTAEKMLIQKLPTSIIAVLTGLSISEIEKIDIMLKNK